MIQEPCDFIINTITLGDMGAGKTTLLRKLAENTIHKNEMTTIGVDFFTISSKVNDYKVKIHLWDAAGNNRYYNLIKEYFKNNSICYFVYDVTNKLSFEHIPLWINNYNQCALNNNTVFVLVANKIDRQKRIITTEQGKKMASNFNMLYIETSSKNVIGFDRIISEPVSKLFELYHRKILIPSNTNGFKYHKEEKKCCLVQ